MEAVLKIGGSLSENPANLTLLCQKLSDLAKRHRILVVPGGGKFADIVRKFDKKYRISDKITHKMAILAMDQYGLLLSNITQSAYFVQNLREVKSTKGILPIFLPSKFMFRKDPFEPSWNVTSDSISAYIADMLGVKKLILVTDVDGIFLQNPKKKLNSKHFKVLSARELLDWNQAGNLTAIAEPREMAEKLFLDVLPVCDYVPVSARVLDIGSGGGFPGIPLKLVRPDLDVTLLDGKRKKVSFLKYVIRVLGLKAIEARQGRAEDFSLKSMDSKGLFRVVISKAVGELNSLLRLSLPLLDREGIVIAMKGAAMEDEVGLAWSTIETEAWPSGGSVKRSSGMCSAQSKFRPKSVVECSRRAAKQVQAQVPLPPGVVLTGIIAAIPSVPVSPGSGYSP